MTFADELARAMIEDWRSPYARELLREDPTGSLLAYRTLREPRRFPAIAAVIQRHAPSGLGLIDVSSIIGSVIQGAAQYGAAVVQAQTQKSIAKMQLQAQRPPPEPTPAVSAMIPGSKESSPIGWLIAALVVLVIALKGR